MSKEHTSIKEIMDNKDSSFPEEIGLLQENQDDMLKNTQPLVLSWKNINCSILSENQERSILNSLTGSASSGNLLAIMGPSGSGKSTFLQVLAGIRQKSGRSISGDIYVNGNSIDSFDYKQYASFVHQQDIMISTLTPREALHFALSIRKVLPNSEQEEMVESLLCHLKLENVGDCLIGNFFQKGLSGGEKKRLSIGIELISQPYILILDEPTSGLDSVSANLIIDILKEQCLRGRTVITTIHQPSVSIFNRIDNLILITEGKEIYQGPAKDSVQYFKDIGLECPELANPADHFMKILFIRNSLDKTEEENRRLGLLFTEWKERNDIGKERIVKSQLHSLDGFQKPSEFQKLIILLKRAFLMTYRTPELMFMKLLQFSFLGIFSSLVFFNLGNGADDFTNRNGYLFMAVVDNSIVPIQNSLIACNI